MTLARFGVWSTNQGRRTCRDREAEAIDGVGKGREYPLPGQPGAERAVLGIYLDFLTRGGWSQCQGVADQTNFANYAIVGLRTTFYTL